MRMDGTWNHPADLLCKPPWPAQLWTPIGSYPSKRFGVNSGFLLRSLDVDSLLVRDHGPLVSTFEAYRRHSVGYGWSRCSTATLHGPAPTGTSRAYCTSEALSLLGSGNVITEIEFGTNCLPTGTALRAKPEENSVRPSSAMPRGPGPTPNRLM